MPKDSRSGPQKTKKQAAADGKKKRGVVEKEEKKAEYPSFKA